MWTEVRLVLKSRSILYDHGSYLRQSTDHLQPPPDRPHRDKRRKGGPPSPSARRQDSRPSSPVQADKEHDRSDNIRPTNGVSDQARMDIDKTGEAGAQSTTMPAQAWNTTT